MAVNMVASVDGKASREGKASGIGSGTDREVMRRLRAKADAVVIGAGTLRAERLSLGLDARRRGSSGRGRGVARGKDRAAQPMAVIVTAGGDVALENLILAPGQQLVVFAAEGSPAGKLEALRARGAAVVTTGKDGSGPGLDLREVVEKLASDHGVEVLLAEGGPTLNRALISAGLVDELFLTVAPKLLGGPGVAGGAETDRPAPKTIVEGEHFERPTNLKLLSAHRAGDELFLRYAL